MPVRGVVAGPLRGPGDRHAALVAVLSDPQTRVVVPTLLSLKVRQNPVGGGKHPDPFQVAARAVFQMNVLQPGLPVGW